MSDYFVQVELELAEGEFVPDETFQDLDSLMLAKGLSRQVTASDQTVCNLPFGIYFGSSDLAAEDLAKAVQSWISPQLWDDVVVLAIEAGTWGVIYPA